MQKEYQYVIVGGGMVADYAARGIREHDKEGSIGIFSTDTDEPYTRPALSKKLWTDESFTEDKVPFNTKKETRADIALETKVTAIDREAKQIELGSGEKIGYGQLLLATGGEPNRIKGEPSDRVIAFRTFADYRHLRKLVKEQKHFIVVGGGYIGTEIAAALVQNGAEVTLVVSDEKLGSSMFPDQLASEYHQTFEKNGVEIVTGRKADKYEETDDGLQVTLDNGDVMSADALVIGLGVEPRIELAEKSGLAVDDGVIVDEQFQTSDPNIWAAGDIAFYPDAILGKQRVEHVDHARNSGKVVGEAMAGASVLYTYTPYLYSVVFDISWQAIGALDASLDTVIDDRENGKIVFYLQEGELKGVLLWNVEVELDDVRALLAKPEEPLVGKLKEKS